MSREEIEDQAFERRDRQLVIIATFLAGAAFGMLQALVIVWLTS